MTNKKKVEDVDVTIEDVLGDSFQDNSSIPVDEDALDQPPLTHLSHKHNKENILTETELIIDAKKEEVKKDPKAMAEDALTLALRLEGWNKSCRDLFLDLRTVTFTATEEEMFIECNDKEYYSKPLYFKADPQKPKDPKIVHAQNIPY